MIKHDAYQANCFHIRNEIISFFVCHYITTVKLYDLMKIFDFVCKINRK
jgi:hypothetical protein